MNSHTNVNQMILIKILNSNHKDFTVEIKIFWILKGKLIKYYILNDSEITIMQFRTPCQY